MNNEIILEVIGELSDKLSKYDYCMEWDSVNKVIYIKHGTQVILDLDIGFYIGWVNSKEELINTIECKLNEKVNEIRSISKILQDRFVPMKDSMDDSYGRIIDMFPDCVEEAESEDEPIIELVLIKEDKINSVYEDYLYHRGDTIGSVVSGLNFYRLECNYDFMVESVVIVTDSLDKVDEVELGKVEIVTIDGRFGDDVIVDVVGRCGRVVREYVNVC